MNNPPAVADERVNMAVYRQDIPRWKRIYQNSLTQMLLLSVQGFCGPAMADAIAGKFGADRPSIFSNTDTS